MNNLLITPSLYTLFLYTLIDDAWPQTDYVLSTRIPCLIHNNLRKIGAEVYTVPQMPDNLILKLFWENTEYMKYLIKSRKKHYDKIYGNDEFHHSYKYRERGIELIEDGPFNSESKGFFQRRMWKQDAFLLNFWFYWLWRGYIPYGYDKKVKKIWHTPKIELNSEITSKGISLNIRDAWEKKNKIQKDKILSLFSLESSLVKEINQYKNVLVTQILPIPDDEKIDIYKRMTVGIEEKTLLIKTHYAENTDYQKYFPKAKIVNAPIPFQLFELLNYTPTHIYTISSSAILPFIKDNTQITFLGTEIDDRIKNAYGIIRYEDILKK